MKKRKIPAILMILGMLNVVFGILLLTVVRNEENARLQRCSEQAAGYVTGVEKVTETIYDNTDENYANREKTETKYKITVSWTIQGVGFKSTQSRTSAIEEGTEFTVWYNPEDATEFYIEGFDSTPEGFAYGDHLPVDWHSAGDWRMAVSEESVLGNPVP